ncbi:hypothetical protein [uncultured Roseobacter sp.]|uniref:hypothetical protein n=1 Tax=uncultured Roseobacter sp. TaxID=114847 RepID=UPI002625C008|nr:hypothetical protein [uncultured Roseobacter sp.]
MPLITYGLVLISLLFSGPLLALAAAKPVPGEVVLVIGPGWAERHDMIVASGGRVLGPIEARFGVFAFSEEHDFAASLLAHGAWFVVDGRRAAFLCGVEA